MRAHWWGLALACALAAPVTHYKTATITVYSDYFHGRRTAAGERFDQGRLTAACSRDKWRVLHGRTVELAYGSRRVRVRINDTLGPKARGWRFDLSSRAASALMGRRWSGRARVHFRLVHIDGYRPRYNAKTRR